LLVAAQLLCATYRAGPRRVPPETATRRSGMSARA
jgi:hypothetical protein